MANIPSDGIQSRDVVPFIDMEFTPKFEKKAPKYTRDVMRSAYSYYVNNKTELSMGSHTRIDELRLIGQGNQSPDLYKRYFSSAFDGDRTVSANVDTYFENSADANRYGWMNTIWDNLSPIANIKTIAKSIVKGIDYDIRANVVDLKAVDNEYRKMMEQYVLSQYKQQLAGLRGKWELPDSQVSPIADEYSEILDIKKQGGFKDHYLLGLEQLLHWTEQYSDWDDNLKERVFDDLFDTRYSFGAVKYNDQDKKPKWFWVDVKDVLVQNSLKHDFSDIDYGGYFDYPTVNELRGDNTLYNGEKNISTKEEWQQLGKSYAEYMGNPTERELNSIESENFNFSGSGGSIRVCRLNLWWKDYETTREVEYTNPYGNKKRRNYKDGEKVSEGDKLVESRVEKIYYGRWIVGTDWMQDWGAMTNMPRKNKREALFPFRGVKLMEKSFTERLAPLAHMFAIAWIRLCNAISKAQNDGYMIDINALAEIDDGGKKLQWDDLVQMWREENILLWDSSTHVGVGGSGAPLQKVQGTLLEDMTKELALMNEMYAKIEQLIGIPPVALGVSPQQDQAVKTTQMSVSSSNTALNYLIRATMRVKKNLSEATCSMWQNAIKYSERCRSEAAKVIGQDDIEGIMVARDEFMELGIDLEPRPSEELKMQFMEIAKVEVGRKNAGQPGIDSIQLLELMRHFETGGSFLEALTRLKYWKKKDTERMAKEKEMAIRQQGEVMDQNARTAGEEERKTETMKSQESQRQAQADITVNSQKIQDQLNADIVEMRTKYELEMKQGSDLVGS